MFMVSLMSIRMVRLKDMFILPEANLFMSRVKLKEVEP